MFGATLVTTITPNVTTGHISDHIKLHRAWNAEQFENTINVMHPDYGAVDGGSAAANTTALNDARAEIVTSGKPGRIFIPAGVDLPVTPDAVLGASDVTYFGGGTISTTQSTAGALLTFPPGSEDFAVDGLRWRGGSDRIMGVALSSTPGNITRRGVIRDNICENCVMGETNPHDTVSGLSYADYDTDPVTGNVTRDIDWINNRGVRTGANLGSHAFIQLWYAIGGQISDNKADGYPYGITGWGGDANPITGDGALPNERRCGGFRVFGNEMKNILDVLGAGAGIWWSMCFGLAVSGANRVENIADVGFDFEGCDGWTCSGNFATNCKNGCLTTFFYSRSGEFGPNTCLQDDASTHEIIARVQNQYAITDNDGVTFTGGTFDCRNGVARIALETADRTILRGSRLTNVRIDGEANNQRHTEVDGINLVLTEELPVALNPDSVMVQTSAINLGRNHIGGRALVTGNTVETRIAQPAGARAIRTYQDDPTHDVLETIDRNTCPGWPTPIETVWNGDNAGFTVTTILRHNLIDVGASIVNTRGAASLATGIAATIVKEGNLYVDGSAVP